MLPNNLTNFILHKQRGTEVSLLPHSKKVLDVQSVGMVAFLWALLLTHSVKIGMFGETVILNGLNALKIMKEMKAWVANKTVII